MTLPFQIALTVALAALAAAPDLAAQDQPPQAEPSVATDAVEPGGRLDPQQPIYDADQLELTYCESRVARLHEAANVLDAFYRRSFLVRWPDGTITGPVTNIRALGDTFVVYDTPEFTARIMEAVAWLEELRRPEPSAETIISTYSPRYVSAATLFKTLSPLTRTVDEPPQHPGGQGTRTTNVVSQDGPPLLVFRDTPERVAEMRALVESIDKPSPEVLITCVLLRGAETGDARLPDELVANLRQLVPAQAFRQVSMAMVRTSVMRGQRQQVQSDTDEDERFMLSFELGQYDADARSLAMPMCQFECGSSRFSTSAVLRAGEYTVLGASGADPIYLVLRVTPIDG